MNINNIKPNTFPEDILILLSGDVFPEIKGYLSLSDKLVKYTAKRLNNKKIQIIIEDKYNGEKS